MYFLPHNTDYVVTVLRSNSKSYYGFDTLSSFIFLAAQKSEPLYLTAVDFSRLHCINPRGVYAAVSEYVGKANDVLFERVEGSGEKMPQIMGKYFFPCHSCAVA